MGRVNVIGPDGKVVSVDEEVVSNALDTGSRIDLAEAGTEGRIAAEKARHERYGGILGTTAATIAGGLDALTLGGYGKGVAALGGGEAYRDVAAEHPTARTVGGAASLLTPGLGELGAASRLGRGAQMLGAGKAVGRIVEGAALGAGGVLAGANVSDDPVTVEALAEGAAIGGVLNYGAGVIADRFTGVGRAAKAEIELTKRAEAAETLFREPPPAYEDLVAARRDAIDAANTTNAEVRRRAAAMAKFTDSTEDFVRTRNGFNRSLREVYTRFVVGPGVEPEIAADAADTIRRSEAIIRKASGPIRLLDRERAIDLLRPVREELAGKFDVVVPDLPAIPGEPVPVPAPLPATMEKFAISRADTVARIANGSTGAEGEAVAKLADALGVAPNVGPGATLADIHAALAEHAGAMSAMAAEAGAETTPPLIRALKWAARKTVKTAVGGAVGSLFGPSGKILGEVIGLTSGDVAAAAVMEAKSAFRAKVRQLAASAGERVGAAEARLGPVTGWLSTGFPSGRKDPETDLGVLARNRARELAAAQVSAPDMSYSAVAPLSSLPGGLGLRTHLQVIGAVGHAYAAAPKDSGLAPHGAGSDWKPGAEDAVALAYRLEAINDPMGAIQRALSGEVHPAAVETLRTVWPATVSAVLTELAGAHAPFVTRSAGVSALSGAPQFGLDDPGSSLSLQAMYFPKTQAASPSRGTGGAPGRPPRTGRTEVAGSNVASLITR